MPGMRCAVAICNNCITTQDPAKEHVMFHKFPKPPDVKKVWVQRCARNDKWNPDTSRVCSNHFQPEDYLRDLKAELLNIPPKRLLKKDAIPSQNLKPKSVVPAAQDSSSTVKSSVPNDELRIIRQEKRTQRKLAQHLLVTADDSEPSSIEPENVPTQSGESCVNCTELEDIKKKYQEAQDELSALKKNLSKMQEIINDCKNKQKIEGLSLNQLKREIQKLKRQHRSQKIIEKKVKDILLSIFTENQINLLLGKRKRVNWSNEEISTAFTLRYLSRRAYIYLRQKLKYPLPGLSTLQQWASKMNIRQGILTDVLKVMKSVSSTLSEPEKLVVVQFDEMKVKKGYEYDVKCDELVGPHSQMQVVMVRGLFCSWKQPVYVDFDKKMTVTTLNSIIIELHNIGYTVVSCVADMGGGNQGLWRELGMNLNKCWFLHPLKRNKRIYCFADAPHLLKLIRNWFIDTGFTLANGQSVNVKPIAALLKLDKNEVKVCHSLQPIHLECVKVQRQNVRLAGQLISHTTAKALQHYIPGNDEKLALSTAQFIETVNSWFDVMNSYQKLVPGYPSKCAFGECIVEQKKVLQEMYEMVIGMRCFGKTFLQVFQKAILISISSIKELFSDMKLDYGIKYILTHRLNQDSLENFFSQIRTRGGLDDHPTPMNALYRMRMIILGKNPGVVQKQSNTVEKITVEYMVASALKSTGITVQLTNSDITDRRNSTEVEDMYVNSENIMPEEKETSLILNEIETSIENSNLSETEEDGLFYIAGWVARKLKSKFPQLGNPTRVLTLQSGQAPSWIQRLSFGGLIEPTDEWKANAKILESEFCKHHGKNGICRGPGVVATLVNKLSLAYPEISEDVIKVFVKIRTFIRIKFLNVKLQDDDKKNQNYKTKRVYESANDDSKRKLSKKMKKVLL